MKVAIVHEWFVNYAGSEKVVEQILKCFPQADLFAVVDFLKDDERGFIMNKPVRTSFIQSLPFARTKYRTYLPLMPLAIEQFDLSGYDLVLSSSHAVSKGVLTGPDQLHISYIHSPIRYAWDLQHQYLQESGLVKGPKSFLARALLHKIRKWEPRTVSIIFWRIRSLLPVVFTKLTDATRRLCILQSTSVRSNWNSRKRIFT
jgi:hypothetical protein